MRSVFEADMYCKKLLRLRNRAAFAKFRCGVAPLRIVTGRFENKPLEERECPFCDNIENEKHVLLDCNMYSDLKHELFCRATIIEPYFDIFSVGNKIRFFFSNHDMITIVAKTCFNILQRRAFYLWYFIQTDFVLKQRKFNIVIHVLSLMCSSNIARREYVS